MGAVDRVDCCLPRIFNKIRGFVIPVDRVDRFPSTLDYSYRDTVFSNSQSASFLVYSVYLSTADQWHGTYLACPFIGPEVN